MADLLLERTTRGHYDVVAIGQEMTRRRGCHPHFTVWISNLGRLGWQPYLEPRGGSGCSWPSAPGATALLLPLYFETIPRFGD